MITKKRIKIYRNTTDAKIMGVCAGIADYLEIGPNIIRVFFVLAVLITNLWLGILIYFFLGFVLKPKLSPYKEQAEEAGYSRYNYDRKNDRLRPEISEQAMRERFQDIERRTNKMEAEITSKRFRLERELEKLSSE